MKKDEPKQETMLQFVVFAIVITAIGFLVLQIGSCLENL